MNLMLQIKIGEYTVERYDDRGHELWIFTIGDRPRGHEYYDTLDMCLIAMVGEKYCGPRTASGPGVGTAADWYACMIGLAVPLREVPSKAVKPKASVAMHGCTGVIVGDHVTQTLNFD